MSLKSCFLYEKKFAIRAGYFCPLFFNFNLPHTIGLNFPKFKLQSIIFFDNFDLKAVDKF